MTKKLALKRELLTELTGDDLRAVAGAGNVTTKCATLSVCAVWSDYCPGTASSAC